MTTGAARSLRSFLSASAAVWMLAAALTAQPSAPYRVEDINRQAVATEGAPDFFVPLAGGTLFVRPRPGGNSQLWRTDGTAAGAFQLAADCAADCLLNPRFLAASAERSYWLGDNEHSGRDLWVSDATEAGTRRLTRLPPSALIADEAKIAVASGRLFFGVVDGETGFEPWVSDGSEAGTRLLDDIRPGPESSFPSFEFSGGALGSTVIFAADDGTTGKELWASDGTTAGTRRVRDIWEGPEGSSPLGFADVGDAVLFFARDPLHGREIWRTDGTESGTQRVVDLTPGPSGTEEATRFFVLGDKALFVARGDLPSANLWVTDGTAAGTLPVTSFGADHHGIPVLRIAGSRLFFKVDDGSGCRKLWASDGTPSGTRELPISCPTDDSFFSLPVEHGGVTVLVARDEAHGRELWTTDGTPDGTRLLVDLCPGACSSDPFPVAGAAGELLFLADDGRSGLELWRTRGDEASTVRLTGFEAREPFANQRHAGRVAGDFLFLGVDLAHGMALWRSDGTPEGTAPFATLSPARNQGSFPEELTEVGGRIYFTADDGVLGCGLWSSDGTTTGTCLLRAFPSGGGSCGPFRRPTELTRAGDRLFFVDPRPEEGSDLWVSDGSGEGTVRVRPGVGRQGADVRLLALGERLLFFSLVAGQSQLWVSDGSEGGTQPIRDLSVGGFLSPEIFEAAMYFFADDPERFDQPALWRSDGTAAGTLPVVDAGDAGGSPNELTRAGDRLFFSARVAGNDVLWQSDGTAAGTAAVEVSGSAPRFVSGLTAVGNRVFFFAFDDLDEPFLWVSDGTAEGTVQLAEVSLNGSDSVPPQRVALGDRLFFIDARPNRSPRLWISDGTLAGTRPFDALPSFLEPAGVWAAGGRLLVAATGGDDLPAVQLWSSDPTGASAALLGTFAGRARPEELGEFVELGDRVLFRAGDETFGVELWAFSGDGGPPPPPPGPPAAPTRLAAEPVSAFAVRLSWRDNAGDETDYLIERGSPLFPPRTVAALPADSESFVVEGLTPGLPYTFRVRASNAGGPSAWSAEASATPFDPEGGPCQADAATLCLGGGRFRVRVRWKDPFNGGNGPGRALPFEFSDDSATFWFFDPDNVELVVKALDARTVNGFFWFFYGALSNVEYWITVTDTLEGTNRTYHNPPRELCGLGDVRAFPRPPGPVPSGLSAPARHAPPTSPRQIADEPAPDCTPGPESLCLDGGRFRVEVAWADPRSGDRGVGRAISDTGDSGFFWFFDPANVELVVKVLDGRPVNGRFWVFYGALSDVEYEITVTDTRNGVSRVYRNEPFDICGQADTRAF